MSHKGKHRKTGAETSEGTGTEQGLQEDSGLHDEIAEKNEDTAAFIQDGSAAKRPDE
jgi:hypothetical protein